MGLLGRAMSMMQGWTAPPTADPQSYNVACPQGHRLSGYRTEGYQALRCPTCSEGIFVLPRSPLPEPALPATSAPRRIQPTTESYVEDDGLLLSDPPASSNTERPDSGDSAVEIDWVDAVEPEPPSAPKPTPAEVPKTIVRPTPKPKPTVEKAPPIAVEARLTLAEWISKHRNRLIPAAAVLIIFLAVFVRWRRQRLDELPRIAEIGRTEGFKKLDAGQFDAAKQILAAAASAVDGLGGRFEGANAIKQAALEASIFTDLVPEPLERILEEATTYREVKEWTTHFDRLYRGRSVIIESSISAVPDPARPGSPFEIDYRVFIGRGPKPTAVARIDFTGFKYFESSAPKLGDREIFGARLASLELDVATNQWVFTVEPGSGTSITHIKALSAIGWPPFDAIEETQP